MGGIPRSGVFITLAQRTLAQRLRHKHQLAHAMLCEHFIKPVKNPAHPIVDGKIKIGPVRPKPEPGQHPTPNRTHHGGGDGQRGL